MGLLSRYQMSLAEAESRLHRPLEGGPKEGEVAVVMALNKGRVDQAREHLSRSAGFKDDFRHMMEAHLERSSPARRISSYTVKLSVEARDHYWKQALATGTSMAYCLTQALERAYQEAEQGRNLLGSLEAQMLAFTTAVLEVRKELDGVLKRVGSLQDISLRLGKIEGALQDLARRR
jgi:hypothetical protein